MATLKRSHNETSMKNKYDALKELEKGVPQKEVALRFGVQKSTLSTWKRNKTKIEEAYHAGLGNKRMRPEKYEDLNKALMKWFLNCRSENIPLNGVLLKEKAIAFATELKIENFQASDGWLEKWKKRFVYFLLFFLTAFGITVFVIHL